MLSSIILCGGRNTRLNSVGKNITKPLLYYKNKSLLEHHLINSDKLNTKSNYINTFQKREIFEKNAKNLVIAKKSIINNYIACIKKHISGQT